MNILNAPSRDEGSYYLIIFKVVCCEQAEPVELIER